MEIQARRQRGRTHSVLRDFRHCARQTANIRSNRHPPFANPVLAKLRLVRGQETSNKSKPGECPCSGLTFQRRNSRTLQLPANLALIECFQLICTPKLQVRRITHKRRLFTLHELLRKIKRFNLIVKHYFLGHYTVAFNSCRHTRQFPALDNCALRDWPNRPVIGRSIAVAIAVACGTCFRLGKASGPDRGI
jgi:hypothetical protein